MRCATGDRGPRKRTVASWYAEEADGVGTRFAGRTVRPSVFGDAVENLCIIRAGSCLGSTGGRVCPQDLNPLEDFRGRVPIRTENC